MTMYMTTKKSELLFEKARKHLVGGVNSPVRAFGAVGGTPLFIAKAHGAQLEDVDGNEYVDFVGSWGPMILGHNPPVVMEAVRKQLDNGASYGAPCEKEVLLAQLVKDAMPSIELLRFTSSGTEATMSALRLARAHTRRVRIVKFEGAYHGHSDSLLVAAGSGATTFGVPSSAGVPEFLAQNTWVLPYNDPEALDDLFVKQGPNIAAVIIEPVCGNMGVVKPAKGFLDLLTRLCKRHGALLIFDEVMTGFRLGWGGAQAMFGVKPDLTCLGKIIGGGFPVGAFGGRKDVMEKIAPLGPVYQAGTLSGNPVAMSAGLALLGELKKTNPYDRLEQATAELAAFVRAAARDNKIPAQVNQVGSMFTIFFNDGPVTNYLQATNSDTARYGRFFHELLRRGVYMPPAQYEAAFVSTLHTPTVMDTAEKAFVGAFQALLKR
jgi:glutamate-1-semialdehyde 2,1-aminomutase